MTMYTLQDYTLIHVNPLFNLVKLGLGLSSLKLMVIIYLFTHLNTLSWSGLQWIQSLYQECVMGIQPE